MVLTPLHQTPITVRPRLIPIVSGNQEDNFEEALNNAHKLTAAPNSKIRK